MVYSVIKKSYRRTYSESILGHALIIRRRVLYSSFLLLYFFNPFCSLFLSLFFFQSIFLPSLFFSSFFVLYTMAFFTISSIHVWIRWWKSFFLLLHPFLESSILSCKAACSLFRHHLHINAARGLARQHLMRRQQYPQIFVFSHSYPLYDISSFTLLQGLSEALP